ncbi:MAG TPA: hypothetical protein VIG32_03165 [Candidatus Baltobacteraceae bacterium]|jgi:hypothetical protein
MTRTGRFVASALAVSALALSTFSPSRAAVDSNALLQRMGQLNPHLKTYTASIHADVDLHAFLSLSPTLDGTYYHKEPDKDKLVFTSGLPTIAKQFSKVYPHIDNPSEWGTVYAITPEGDNGTTTTLKLVPRKQSRVDHIDVKIDDKRATIDEMRWTYTDGGYALLDQTYSRVGGNYLVSRQTGHVDTPHYTADVKSTFSNFKLNIPISDAVFKEDS